MSALHFYAFPLYFSMKIACTVLIGIGTIVKLVAPTVIYPCQWGPYAEFICPDYTGMGELGDVSLIVAFRM